MSILGTLGPLVQGSSRSLTDRIRTATVFGVAFVAGAIAIFAVVHSLGVALGIAELPIRWRAGIASTGLVGFASIDLLAIGQSRYCPLGWRRQTPRVLARRHSAVSVAAAWGFDTGLAVTTIRVAAVTWGALLLAGLGFSVWWSGLGYGLTFAIPFVLLLRKHRVGRCAREPAPTDPGLESMLGKRGAIQGLSAVSLLAAAAILVATLTV